MQPAEKRGPCIKRGFKSKSPILGGGCLMRPVGYHFEAGLSRSIKCGSGCYFKLLHHDFEAHKCKLPLLGSVS